MYKANIADLFVCFFCFWFVNFKNVHISLLTDLEQNFMNLTKKDKLALILIFVVESTSTKDLTLKIDELDKNSMK